MTVDTLTIAPKQLTQRIMLDILYEDNHLLAVNKPAGLPTMGVAADKASLLTVARDYLRQRYSKTGNVYLGIVSRLDAPVTGVTLLARTSKAAGRLTKQFHDRQVEKTYWALVTGHVDPPQGECDDWLRKHERHRRVEICTADALDAQQANLSYRVLEQWNDLSLLEVQLETGRKHQIRVQLAHRGHPILGDRKYDSDELFPAGIALHARHLKVIHPTQKTEIEFTAPLPNTWRKWVGEELEQQLGKTSEND